MPVKIGLFAGALFATASSAYAGAILIPPNLNPGDTYRIIFVTDSTINATSANAADYNAFVTTAAQNDPGLAALQTTWTALVSTGSTGVFTNTGLSSSDSTTAFYNTQGQLIAQGANGGPNSLYGGSHLAGIFDPNGAAPLDTNRMDRNHVRRQYIPFLLGHKFLARRIE